MRASSIPSRLRLVRRFSSAKRSQPTPQAPRTPRSLRTLDEPYEPQSAYRLYERHDGSSQRRRHHSRHPDGANRVAYHSVGVDVCRSDVARAASPSRARDPQHRLLRPLERRHAGDAPEIRERSGVEPPCVWRAHGLQRRAHHLSPADRVMGCGQPGRTERALARVPRHAIDDERLRRTSAHRARSMEGNHRSHAARTLWHDGSRHGVVESAPRRAPAGICRTAAAWRVSPDRRRRAAAQGTKRVSRGTGGNRRARATPLSMDGFVLAMPRSSRTARSVFWAVRAWTSSRAAGTRSRHSKSKKCSVHIRRLPSALSWVWMMSNGDSACAVLRNCVPASPWSSTS